MCDSMSQKNVFYSCVIPFLAFFASFALLFYPMSGVLHPHALCDKVRRNACRVVCEVPFRLAFPFCV